MDYDGNVYVTAEHYEQGKDIDYHANAIKTMAKKLNWHMGRNGLYEALIDSAANQRTLASAKSVAELFFEKGIAVNTNVNKELFSGIATVKDYFASRPPRIFIFRNCVNMIREIKSYWWGKGDNPVKKDDHSMDELRYYLMTRPINRPDRPVKTLQQQYKEKLTKRIKNR